MIKKISYLALAFFISSTTWAQFGLSLEEATENPSEWKASVKKTSDSVYTISVVATIDATWHLPSQRELGEDENGPIPTEFNFEYDSEKLERLGSTQEPQGITKFDEIFETNLTYFEDRAVFEQDFRVKAENATLDLEILFMICNDVMCLPQDQQRFNFKVQNSILQLAETKSIEVKNKDKTNAEALKLNLIGKSDYRLNSDEPDDSNLTIFLLGFVGGLIALLTPCVFPMIPLTVSFLLRGQKPKS